MAAEALAPVYVAIVGLGGVGNHFLTQLSALPSALRPSLIFVSRSRINLVSKDYRPITPSQASTLLSSSSNETLLSPSELASYLEKAPGRAILVDNTSNQNIAESYPLFLSRGVNIVTPNKKAFSSSISLWDDIFDSISSSHDKTMIYHESSVGAGLPVISTLKDLVATGDSITRIEGVFSGTMSFLFNTFAPVSSSPSSSSSTSTSSWSQIVTQAKQAGYTEPDPRDDLNGMDVARKLTILARLSGLRVDGPDSFPIQSLIPTALASASSPEEFLSKLPEHDHEMETYKTEAEKQGKVVRYVGSIDVGSKKVEVGLQNVDKSGPIAGLKGSDNLICFYTKRYGENPLVIQGAGAGGEVTAMGVTSDLLKVMERLR